MNKIGQLMGRIIGLGGGPKCLGESRSRCGRLIALFGRLLCSCSRGR
jgi:hypothetical protein